jgi:hypothetical protein
MCGLNSQIRGLPPAGERERRKKKAQKTNETPDESRCFSRFSKYLFEASSFSARMTFNSPSK